MNLSRSVLIATGAAMLLLLSQPTVSAQAAAPEKPYRATMIAANVWPAGYSEVWLLDSPGVHFLTNMDLAVLGPGLLIERPEADYDFIILPGIFTEEDVRQGQQDGSLDARGLPKHFPQRLPPPGGPAQFIPFVTGASAAGLTGEGWRICDLLHRHYQANRIRIDVEARQREIDQQIATAAEAARRAAIPPRSGPAVTYKRVEHSLSSASSTKK